MRHLNDENRSYQAHPSPALSVQPNGKSPQTVGAPDVGSLIGDDVGLSEPVTVGDPVTSPVLRAVGDPVFSVGDSVTSLVLRTVGDIDFSVEGLMVGEITGVPIGDPMGDPVIGIFTPPPQTQHASFAVYPFFSKKLPQSEHLNPAEACQSQSLPLEFSHP